MKRKQLLLEMAKAPQASLPWKKGLQAVQKNQTLMKAAKNLVNQ